MSSKRIHLIRHGLTNWNQERRIQGREGESLLTAEGKRQAAALRARLAGIHFGQVFCSSSVRTRETAAILFADDNIPIEYSNALREIGLGAWEGDLWPDIQTQFPAQADAFWQRPHEFSLQGAETFLEVQQRGVGKFLQIVGSSVAGNIALISHGVLIKSILCYLEQRPLARLWEPPHLHNCAHSIVEISADRTMKIIQYADSPYPARNEHATQSSTSFITT